jgi:hypothetical protein
MKWVVPTLAAMLGASCGDSTAAGPAAPAQIVIISNVTMGLHANYTLAPVVLHTVGTATISASAAGRSTQITLFSDLPAVIDGDYNATGNNFSRCVKCSH